MKTTWLKTPYSVVVAALLGCGGDSGTGPDSAEDGASATDGVQVLSAVSDSLESGGVTLVWSGYRGDDEFDRYVIERRLGDGEFEALSSRDSATDTTYLDTGVEWSDSTWTYRIVTQTVSGILESDPVEVRILLPGTDDPGVNGYVVLSDQAALDEFAGAGEGGPFVIRGDLIVDNRLGSADLSGLEQLRTIYGDLVVEGSGLESLAGLDNLEAIHGRLTLRFNGGLTDITALSSVGTIGSLLIVGNSLPDLRGLENLQTTDSIFILENSRLSSLEGLNNLTTVNGNMHLNRNNIVDLEPLSQLTRVEGALEITTTAFERSLLSIEHLGNLRHVGGDLILTNHFLLDNVDVLRNLQHVGGFQLINSGVASIDGLDHLFTELDGSLVLRGNDALVEIDEFANLTRVGGQLTMSGLALPDPDLPRLEVVGWHFEVGSNTTMETLEGFANLREVGGDLTIMATSVLTSLNGLASLDSVGGEVTLWGNSSLTDISALAKLTSLDGLTIAFNRELVELSGLDGIESITANPLSFDAGGRLWISNNDKLESLAALGRLARIESDVLVNGNPLLRDVALGSLDAVGGDMSISTNASLVDLNGLGSLADVEGRLLVEDNESLTSVSGLGSLKRVGLELTIRHNPALTDIGGFPGLESVGGLTIQANRALPNRLAVAVVERLLSEGVIPAGSGLAGGNQWDPVFETEVRVLQDVVTVAASLDQFDPLDLTQGPLVVEALVQLAPETTMESIEWDADLPAGTSVELRTRSGSSVSEVLRYFDVDGEEMTEERYDRLPSPFKGEILTSFEMGEGWTELSEPHEWGGQMDEPSGQQFLLIEVTYRSTDPALVPTLHEIRIQLE